MSGFQLAGRRWWLRGYLAGRPHQGGSPIHSMVGPPQGLPRRTPERILGTNTARALQVPVRQWRRLTALVQDQTMVITRCYNCASAQRQQSSLLAWTGWQSSLGQLCGATGGYPLWCVFAEVFGCVAGRSRRKAYSWYHAARPSRCGWLAELHVIAEEPMAYLYNSGHSHRGDFWTGLQQRAAQAAGQASVDGGQVTVGGACWPNVRQSPHREVQRRTRCSALRQGRQTQPHRPIWREKVSWVWNQRSPGMVEEMSGLDGTL